MKKIFRKIHLWLSVPFGIIITLVCFSGATMVYEKEITEWWQHDLYKVKEVKEQTLPMDSLMRIAAATLPDSVEITGVTISPDPERLYQVSLSKPRRASMFIDQYTGEVKGRSSRLPFFDTMFHLHRWLLGSSQTASGGMSVGKLLVGTSTLVLVIILVTGILMWLTNRHKPLRKSLTISVTKGWGRFWHDLHVAGGIYTTIFLLAIALTGLTWSFSWYRTGFYSLFGVEATDSHGGGSHGGGSHGGGRGQQHGNRDGHRHGGPHRQEAVTAEKDSAAHDGRRAGRRPEGMPEAKLVSKPVSKSLSKQDVNVAEAEQPDTARQFASESRRRGHGGDWHRHHGDSTAVRAWRQHGDSSNVATLFEEEIAARRARAHRRHDGASTATRPWHGNRQGTPAESKPHRRESARAAVKADTISAVSHDTLAVAVAASPYANWQKVADKLATDNSGYQLIGIADGTATVVPQGRNSLRATDNYTFDPSTGDITSCQPYAQQDKAAKVRSVVYMTHVGSWGGWLTRLITFIASLIGATLPLTGYYLWIRRLTRKRAQQHSDVHHQKG